ncbi:hypothetical protein CASFOL_042425 [Castilleja foliolosa]|uniref:Uncharacterized protein n=1 Tax=Castilleja foliolosa TaxID=1961234 RepID=A0ABD3BB72_9LAMI
MMLQLICSLREKDLWKVRTRPGGSWCLPTNMAVSKRKSIATEMGSKKKMRSTLSGPAIVTTGEFTFCDGICPLDTYFKNIYNTKSGSLLGSLYNRYYLTIMVDKIFEDPSDFLATATICMSGLLKLVEERVLISDECAQSLFVGVWLDPRFLYSFSEAIEHGSIISDVLCNTTQNSLDDRIASMFADEFFEETVCDLLMGKNIFGRRIELRNKGRARAEKIYGLKPDEVHKFSFEVDDIMNLKDMKPVKDLMAKKYSSRKDVDIESLTLKIKSDIFSDIFSRQTPHPCAGLKAKGFWSLRTRAAKINSSTISNPAAETKSIFS